MSFEKSKDYVEVKDRIPMFYAAYPNGVLRSDPPEFIHDGGNIIGVVSRAYAHRGPDDQLPAVGTAFEVYPGRTPYTKGSEVMNAETSAWGRAIVAAGAASANVSVASADEVRLRQQEQAEEKATEPLRKQLQGFGKDVAISAFKAAGGVGPVSQCIDAEILTKAVALAAEQS